MQYITEMVDGVVADFQTRNPQEICDLLDIEVIDYDFSKNIKGFVVFDTVKTKKIIALNNTLSIPHRKFVLAHELGHAFLHPDTSRYFIEKATNLLKSKIEREADFFAAELLIADEDIIMYRKVQKAVHELQLPEELIEIKLGKFCSAGGVNDEENNNYYDGIIPADRSNGSIW